ncbi:hypothetical protein ZWY2020_038850 [Hordeum vulgare]|nr:hypothetical protein ZWY2020_038850 [Hordeum vulgare]
MGLALSLLPGSPALSPPDSSSSNASGSDDWVEPAAYVLNSTTLLTREHRNVLDAFRLLQRYPNVQKMVMSLSCDRTYHIYLFTATCTYGGSNEAIKAEIYDPWRGDAQSRAIHRRPTIVVLNMMLRSILRPDYLHFTGSLDYIDGMLEDDFLYHGLY